jgi:HAD superfamily hydrolase (TIGR01509 family)
MQHLIFDCDGVLVDSEILAARIALRMLAPYGIQPGEAEFCRRFSGMMEQDILAVLQAEYAVRLPETFMEELLAASRHAHETELEAIPGMPAMLEALPPLPKSVASNSSVRHVAHSLQRTGMSGYFGERYFSSHHVPRPKPAPDVYLHALSQIGLTAADCLVVEDSVAGATAALAAGLDVIGFLGGGHIFEAHADRLRQAGVRVLAADAEELRALLLARMG